MQRNAKLIGNASRILEVFRGRAVALLVLFPVVHEQALDVMTCAAHAAGR